ncbi:hypothetical protein FOCG_08813 [Fusarium oxysporum f. sp. radicis-lycopersici 26381]|nr:hypothetical protein FOCG_08813 [Fusarium oxysporum f. sp. radicis-lycopersici 26381]
MITLASPSEASRKATKQASRVMSSLKNTLWSTFSKTPKQHLKEQMPKYQLCSNPSITITDAETGEEWDFVDHDELDGDLANSDDNRTSSEELEMNAREQEDLLLATVLPLRFPVAQGERDMLAVRRNSPVPVEQEISRRSSHRLEIERIYSRCLWPNPTLISFLQSSSTSLPPGLLEISNHQHQPANTNYTPNFGRLIRQPSTLSPGLPGYRYHQTLTCTSQLGRNSLLHLARGVHKAQHVLHAGQEGDHPDQGPLDEEKDRDLKESTVIHLEDATEPWELIPTIKDDPWTVVVKSRSMLGEFKDGNGDRQSHYERAYQHEFDRQVVVADRLALREAKMRTAK